MKKAKITLSDHNMFVVNYTTKYVCANSSTPKAEHYMSFMIKTENNCFEVLVINPHDIIDFEEL